MKQRRDMTIRTHSLDGVQIGSEVQVNLSKPFICNPQHFAYDAKQDISFFLEKGAVERLNYANKTLQTVSISADSKWQNAYGIFMLKDNESFSIIDAAVSKVIQTLNVELDRIAPPELNFDVASGELLVAIMDKTVIHIISCYK